MKAQALLRVLQRAPLSYRQTNKSGTSHRKMESDSGYPTLFFSFHDSVEVGGTMIKNILLDQVGLDEKSARDILKG
jgi:hypothetical protein